MIFNLKIILPSRSICGEPLEFSFTTDELSSGSPHMDRDGSKQNKTVFIVGINNKMRRY